MFLKEGSRLHKADGLPADSWMPRVGPGNLSTRSAAGMQAHKLVPEEFGGGGTEQILSGGTRQQARVTVDMDRDVGPSGGAGGSHSQC